MTQTYHFPDKESRINFFREELMTLSYRYHVHHPFDKLLQSGRASKEMLQVWAANRFYYQDTIPRKDAAIIANCDDSSMRGMWCNHILTHDVNGALTEWLLLTDSLDLERKEVMNGTYLLPGTKFACDAYLHFCKEMSWQDGMCSSMTHLFAGDIHKMRIRNWPTLYPWLPEDAFRYFRQRDTTLPDEVDTTLQVLSEYYTQSEDRMKRAKHILSFKQDILWTMMDTLWHYFMSKSCRMSASPPLIRVPDHKETVLRILGSGAGGGVPQWNMNDDWNGSHRFSVRESKSQCSAAVRVGSDDSPGWILINCSPDFRSQWNRTVRDHPRSHILGILLTDAELDHITGLLSLRESKEPIRIYTTSSIRKNIEESGISSLLRKYVHLDWKEIEEIPCQSFLTKSLARKKPKYASEESDMLVLVFGNLLYAPCIPDYATVSSLFRSHVGKTFIVDGTFETSSEMPHVKGHVPIQETLLAQREELGSMSEPIIFTRMNHSNRSEHVSTKDGEEYFVTSVCEKDN